MIKKTAVLVTLTLCPYAANAQVPILLGSSQVLNFGTIATSNNAGGTVVIEPGGTRNVSGSVVGVTGGGLEQEGIISIAGSVGLVVDISITNTQFPISDGTNTMVVDNFNLVTVAGGDSLSATLTASTIFLDLGARLNVNPNQPEGTYTGSYGVRTNYQ